MDGVYMTAISRWIEIGLVVSGVLILYFAFRAFMSRAAWGEGAEYEMMDMVPPKSSDIPMSDRSPSEEASGLIGLEDRIVRIGFSIALTYLAITWFGLRSLAMWLLAAPVLYCAVTSMIGKDPIYSLFGLTTKVE